ncbi:MAG: ABC transporter substrate-binding protein [Bacillota bacterium]
MFSKQTKVILALTLVVAIGLVGCTQQGGNQQSTGEQTKSISFGYVEWPGVTVKTHVAQKIFEYLGYEVESQGLVQQVLFKGMENDEIDAFLGNWMPTMKVNFEEYQKKGVVENVQVNLEEALYQTAVPEYVWEAGVKSMEDLDEHADKFDHEIVGIEPGNDGNRIIKKAIENDTYNLGDWELVTGSTAAMLSAVNKATKNQDWIAFHGWKPHWMNVKFDLKYLEDPENIWGSKDRVYSAARPELKEEQPNFYKFLEQFKVTSQIQSKWILEYQEKERDPEKVAEEWISNNLDLVSEWVASVKSVDGKDAMEVIKQKVK